MIRSTVASSRCPRGEDRRVVVVGSGAVGLFLAKALSDRGIDVTVVESGLTTLGAFPKGSFRVAGRKHDGIAIGRSRSLGGTSNLWGGQLVEFQECDFDGSSGGGQRAWPIRLDQLRPYYRQAYSRLGVPEELQGDPVVWEGTVGSQPEPVPGFEVFLTRWMRTPSLSFMYRDAIRNSDSLEVLLGHTAVGFEFDRGRATALRLRRPDGRIELIKGSSFVVSAGTIENSRLLLTSALDDPGCPWAGNDNLGRYFQDHLGAKIAVIRPTDLSRFFRIFSSIHWRGQKFQPKLRLEERLIRERGILSTQAMIAFEGSVSENLLFLRQFLKAAVFSRSFDGISSIPRTLAGCAAYLPPLMWTYIKDNRIFVPSDAKITIKVQAEQLARRESRITVDPALRDRFGLPQVVLDWRVGDEEIRSIREFLVLCDESFRRAGLGSVEIDPAVLSGDIGALGLFRDTNHPAGGTIMSEAADSGVVDRDLRVFGADNCFVVGASVFPTSSNANVTFTAMALSLRLADLLSNPNASESKHSRHQS